MQFGIFSIGDLTTDPVSGKTPTESERIRNLTEIALKAEEVGLDVFATGEHHNPPFVPSSPTTHLAYIAAQTERLQLSTATTLITTNDPVKIAEDYAFLQHLADGRVESLWPLRTITFCAGFGASRLLTGKESSVLDWKGLPLLRPH